MMLDLTTTTCRVNESQTREVLAKSERYHALTRTETAPAQRPSLAVRLAQELARPVRTLVPQHES